jgi:hypothetical protein
MPIKSCYSKDQMTSKSSRKNESMLRGKLFQSAHGGASSARGGDKTNDALQMHKDLIVANIVSNNT